MQAPTPDEKAARGYRIDLHCRFARASSRPARIVLESGPTRSLVAKFPHATLAAWSMRISYCKRGTLRRRLRTGVCETLLPDIVAPEAHQNMIAAIVRELSGPTFRSLYARILHGGQLYTEDLKQLSKLGGIRLRGWALDRDNTDNL